jgi:hypothetical protein
MGGIAYQMGDCSAAEAPNAFHWQNWLHSVDSNLKGEVVGPVQVARVEPATGHDPVGYCFGPGNQSLKHGKRSASRSCQGRRIGMPECTCASVGASLGESSLKRWLFVNWQTLPHQGEECSRKMRGYEALLAGQL